MAKLDQRIMARRVNWLTSIRDWQQEFVGSLSAREFVDCITGDLLGQGVFVFTPSGAVMRLPKVRLALLARLLVPILIAPQRASWAMVSFQGLVACCMGDLFLSMMHCLLRECLHHDGSCPRAVAKGGVLSHQATSVL